MFRKRLILLFLVFGHKFFYAQILNSFYLEPFNSWKIEVPVSPGKTKQPIILPYVRIETYKYIYPRYWNESSAGLSIGYRFKNSDKLQLSLMYDGSLQGFYGQSWRRSSVSKNAGLDPFGFYSGPLAEHYSLLYKRCLIRFEQGSKRYVKCHANLGLSYFYKPNNGIEEQQYYGDEFLTPDSTYYFISAIQYVTPETFLKSLKLNLGFDLTFGRGDREWFTLNVAAIFSNNSQLSRTDVRIESITRQGKAEVYEYTLRGSGNGIYFTLSRRIFPFRNYDPERRAKRRYEKERNKK